MVFTEFIFKFSSSIARDRKGFRERNRLSERVREREREKLMERHVIFLIDGSEQSVSEEGDGLYNQLYSLDQRIRKKRIEVLIDVAKALACEGLVSWNKEEEEEEEEEEEGNEYVRVEEEEGSRVKKEEERIFYACVFFDASMKTMNSCASHRKTKVALKHPLTDIDGLFTFFSSMNDVKRTNGEITTFSIDQALKTAILMFKSKKAINDVSRRDVVILNATENVLDLRVSSEAIKKMDVIKVVRSAVFFHSENCSPSSSCLWPTSLEALVSNTPTAGILAICNLRPHQDHFLRPSARSLRKELESNGILKETNNDDDDKYDTFQEARQRAKDFDTKRVEQTAMFPTRKNEEETPKKNQQVLPVRYAENCATSHTKFDVGEERLKGITCATTLRVPIVTLTKNIDNDAENNNATEIINITHVELDSAIIPKVIDAIARPIFTLTKCARMRIEKSKKVKALSRRSSSNINSSSVDAFRGDIVCRQEYLLGGQQETKIIIEFRNNFGTVDRLIAVNKSLTSQIKLIWPLKNDKSERCFALAYDGKKSKYKKCFYFCEANSALHSYAEIVSKFRSVLENPPTLEAMSGVENLNDLAQAAPSLLSLISPSMLIHGEEKRNQQQEQLGRLNELELEHTERKSKLREALRKKKSQSSGAIINKENENIIKYVDQKTKTKKNETVETLEITDRLRTLRRELELRINKEAKQELEPNDKEEEEKEEEENARCEPPALKQSQTDEINTNDNDSTNTKTTKTTSSGGRKVDSSNLFSFFA